MSDDQPTTSTVDGQIDGTSAAPHVEPAVSIEKLKELLLALVPADGTAIGNVTLSALWHAQVKEKFATDLPKTEYWSVRNRLIDEGLLETGKGKGGSVRRIIEQPEPTKEEIAAEYESESELYDPFLDVIRNSYAPAYRIKYFVIEKTAHQGRRATGGKWTRPDISLVAVRVHQFSPGRKLEVITFEVKPAGSYAVDGLFEAASHSAFSHKSYLAIHVPDENEGDLISPDFSRLKRESGRFGTGLITFNDPGDWGTFEVVIEAEQRNPELDEVDAFIRTQLTKESQDVIQELIR